MTASKVVGNRKPPNAGKGRPKGVKNKVTAAAREAFTLAFEGLGGVKALTAWARGNKTEFFKLYARLIPTEVTGKDGGPMTLRVEYVEADD